MVRGQICEQDILHTRLKTFINKGLCKVVDPKTLFLPCRKILAADLTTNRVTYSLLSKLTMSIHVVGPGASF